MEEFWLTTVDNPYDPFTENDKWLFYDEQEMRYFTNGLVARFAVTSDFFSEEENDKEIREAMKRITELFPGKYKIVYR